MTNEHDGDLEELVRTGSPRNRLRVVGMLAVVLPYFALLACEVLGRHDQEPPLPPLPWQEPTVSHSSAWGDLLRLAGLPRYTALFPSESERAKEVETNAQGFRDPRPIEVPADITFIGASFFAAGTTYADTLPAQLGAVTGRTTRSFAWPGQGPVHSVEWALSRPELWAKSSHPEPIVVWEVIQRSLHGWAFASLTERISTDGRFTALSHTARARNIVKASLRWHTALDGSLRATSPARRLTDELASYVPPLSIDPGWSSNVLLTRWADRPALFFGEAVASVFTPLENRDSRTILETIRRAQVAFAKRGHRLVVVLIPDKYQVARVHCSPSLDLGRAPLSLPVTTAFAAQLQGAGIENIDLFPVFSEVEQSAPGSLYRRDDTHWSDEGIQLAAREIAKRL